MACGRSSRALDGYELAAGAWERAVLPARLDRYDPSMLDMICLAGEAGWARLSPAHVQASPRPSLVPATPIALFLREHASAWRALRSRPARSRRSADGARRVLSVLRSRGASFFRDLAPRLRARRRPAAACHRRAGRLRARDLGWILRIAGARVGGAGAPGTARSAQQLRRPVDGDRGDGRQRATRGSGRAPGVVAAPPLRRRVPAAAHPRDERRDVARARARLPAARGARRDPQRPVRHRHVGRAVCATRRGRTAARGSAHRRPTARLVTISAADPLNLAGIVTAGERIRTAGRNRIVYRDGVPLAVLEGGFGRELAPIDPSIARDVSRALKARGVTALAASGLPADRHL